VTPEARAARERKQKIFVAVGGIFLLVMLAIQLPRLLGGSGEPAAAPATPGRAAEPTRPGATPVVLIGSTGAAPAVPGKIASFGTFRKKDPFVQLVVANSAPLGEGKASEGGGKKAEVKGSSKSFSNGEKQAAATVTIVSVNGVRQTLAPGATFPASDPVFVLISEQPAARSVVVGVVGGQYAGGSKTAKLTVGKPLMLVNTATGAKYRISVVSVGSGGAPEEPAKSK
jgi:hypothetical protein